MSLNTSEYPIDAIFDVKDLIEDALPKAKVGFYSSEFFEEDEIKRLVKTVRTRDFYMIDPFSIEDDDNNRDSTRRISSEDLILQIYCGASNLRDDAEGNLAAFRNTAVLRKHLVGKQIAAKNGHSTGIIDFVDISKEFSTRGLAIFTLTIAINFKVDFDA